MSIQIKIINYKICILKMICYVKFLSMYYTQHLVILYIINKINTL